MKCHWCHKELQLIPQDTASDIQVLECPDVHCEIVYDSALDIIMEYTMWVDHNDRRYKIRGHRTPNQTHFMVKKGPHHFSTALTIKRFLVLKPNKEGILEGQAIFNKLKTLRVFS